MKKTISINILDFNYFKTNTYHNVAHMKFEKIKKEEYVDMGYEEEQETVTEKAIINYNFGMASAERHGKEEGLKEGLKEGKREGEEKKKIEIIENMLKLKIDDEIIKKSVNISDEELEKYKKKIRV